MNSKKGISLVALVVTIIILLILAGVTVALTIGKDSTTTRAIESKIDSRYATAMDKVKIRETELGVSKFKDQDGSTAKEFVESLFDEGILIPLEDSYEPDYSKVYIGKIEEGVYKYTIDIIELEDDDIDVGPITFTFNLNGGTINSSPDNEVRVGEKGTTFIMPQNPIKENNIFDGWSPSVPDTFDSTKSFIAKWTPMMNTFTFNLDGGNVDGSGANQLRSGVYGAEVTKPKNPVKNNFDFNGWSPSVPNKFDGNKTFMAQWKPKTYTITYNLNGGIYNNSAVNPTRKVGYNNMPPEIEPTKSGQTFMGWTPEFTVANSNKTYTAMWAIPMEIIMTKASVNEEILIPLEFGTSQFALISNNGGEYIEYNSKHPTITNTVGAGTPFSVKIAGRIKKFSYSFTSTQHKNQINKIISWGELGTEEYRFSGAPPAGGTIVGCLNLTGTIPTPSTNSFINVIILDGVFYDCSGLTGSIPIGLFDKCPNVTTFFGAFHKCSGLTGSIPEGIFDKCPNVTSFVYAFHNCSGLTGSIPEGLFDNCSHATNFFGLFQVCSGLTGSIPANLFANCSSAINFTQTFYKCSGLTGSIGSGLFNSCLNATTFVSTFVDCNGLTGSIPANLFANCSSAISFVNTFYNCSGLTGTIPEGLFDHCPNVTTFHRTFEGCTGLTGVTSGIFNGCLNVVDFTLTFYNCNGLTGNAPDLWNRTNVTTYSQCFRGCTKLLNYDAIPTTWK